MDRLKLFVVGEFSPDPEQWCYRGMRALVVAHNAEEAAGMVEFSDMATEIPFDRPLLILTEG